LSYVDYLGALYNSYTGKIDRKIGSRVFATDKYAKEIKEIKDVKKNTYQ
jgi:hypothetical protein